MAHAYLFSGPRGTGKTSTARILAMALNCAAPVDGEPDGTCASCLAIKNGASMDVFELDAASNRKLDEMRDLLSRVALGTPGRWKVYIIDEVHQLTPDAASALLKTLEEPPSHVVFVLATTDPQRVLPTIVSRAQHFEFHLFSAEVLTALVEEVNQDAGLHLPPEVVQAAVRKARGSARDALSALDQLASAGEEAHQGDSVADLVDALGQRDVGAVLEAVARATSEGMGPRRLGTELVEHLRNAFLAAQAPSLAQVPGDAVAQLAGQASRLGLPLLVRTMEVVGQALVDMRDSVDPRVTLELALMRCASPDVGTSPAALLERIERLERQLAGAGPGLVAPPAPSTAPTAPTAATARQVASSAGTPTSAPGPSSSPATSAPAASQAAHRASGGPGPAQAKMALGAFLKERAAAPASSAAPPPPAGAPGPAQPATAAQPAPATQGAPQPAAALPGQGRATAQPGQRPTDVPDRDELTKAWGDHVLSRLSKPARLYLANGRFIEAGGGQPVLALPDRTVLERARNFLAEAQGALSAHFGRPVPLQLAVDPGVDVAGTPPEEAEHLDLDELAEAAPVPEVPLEERILQTFPGSLFQE